MSAVKLSIMQAGYCTHPEHIVLRGGRWKGIPFPAMFALIEHPHFGPMLFDTGYSQRFFEETRRYPNKLYTQITPVTLREDQLAVCQLEARGIRPQHIERVFISHFHADHVAALGDFPKAQYTYFSHGYDAVRSLRGLSALKNAYLPGLIPADFVDRGVPVSMADRAALPPEYAPFTHGIDVFGDESVIAVELPGHAAGQMGLFLRGNDGDAYLLAADACWLERAYQENRPPHVLANMLFSDAKAYRETLEALHEYHQRQPGVHIIPSHCAETLARFAEPA
jgi:glyoxylase-like metal-dependent hydrolase (beta-lactamase superfamily II)